MKIFKVLFRAFIAYLLVGLLLYAGQDYLVFPRLQDRWFSVKEPVRKLSFPVSQVFVDTPDGHKLDVRTNFDASRKTEYAAIVFHGNGETVEKGNFLPFFNSQGIAAFTFDYRGYGNSSGWPSEQHLYDDALVMYEYVKSVTGLDSSKIILLGNSIGSGFAAKLASEIQPKALILIAPYYSFRNVILGRPVYAPFVYFLRYHMDTIGSLKKLQDTCLIVAHGNHDSVIPFSHAEKIMSETENIQHKVLLHSEQAGHNDIFYKVEDSLVAELARCLG